MNNILAYYYELYPSHIKKIKDDFSFKYNDINYNLKLYNRPYEDVYAIYELNKSMLEKKLLVHKIIVNKENNILTNIDGKFYILLQLDINEKLRISPNDILLINFNTIKLKCEQKLYRNNWIELWESKNDYFESQINDIRIKFPKLCNYANYYIGLAENAISYVRNAIGLKDEDFLCVSHRRINYLDTLNELYDPTEMIFDYRIRDMCEYIKFAFFEGVDAYNLVKLYLTNNFLTFKEILLFYGRLLYPTYFFDIQDKIVNNGLDEKLIENVITKSDDYERFLFDVYVLISNLYNRHIPSIDWIIKRSLVS